MKKLLLVSALALSFSSAANADSFLKNVGDFLSGKNQHYNISENDLLNTQWDKFKDTDKESIYVRRTDKDNDFSDGVWLKHIQKDGSPDEYKHYLTDCNSNDDVLRNAKVTVSNTDGTLDRQKKDKVIKGDLKQGVRKLVCSAPSGSAVPGLVFGTVPESVFSNDSFSDDPELAQSEYLYYLKGDKQKKRIIGQGVKCTDTSDMNTCRDAFVLNGKLVFLKSVNISSDPFISQYNYNGYTLKLHSTSAKCVQIKKGNSKWVHNFDLRVEKNDYKKVYKVIEEQPIFDSCN